MKLDFLICGTPTDVFCSQIAFFRLCLDNLGGDYKNARLVATFGDHLVERIPERWQPYFNNIEVKWSHPVGAVNPDYFAQHYHRFKVFRPDADMVIICDADTALIRPFPKLLDMCSQTPALFGVIAHYHMSTDKDWQEIAKAVINKPIKIEYNYTLEASDSLPVAPFYINYGFLAGTPALLTKLYNNDITLIDSIIQQVGPFWASQVSVALVSENLNLPRFALPLRYNFPNDKKADQLYPNELEKIILLHYLRNTIYDRHKIFTNEKEFDFFMNLDLYGSDKVFQQHVSKLTDGKYPFT
ncbi:MAG: hypothetical protein JKY19_02245 [Alcanivoracaceae bacterium]|nr:hypothetical protein [Alcanivoracaceae bacterium]